MAWISIILFMENNHYVSNSSSTETNMMLSNVGIHLGLWFVVPYMMSSKWLLLVGFCDVLFSAIDCYILRHDMDDNIPLP